MTPSLSKSMVTVKLVPPLAGTTTLALKSGVEPSGGTVAWRRIESVLACSRYPANSRSDAESRMAARARVTPRTAKVETIEIIASVITTWIRENPFSRYWKVRARALPCLVALVIAASIGSISSIA
jgi:hypothetical protein